VEPLDGETNAVLLRWGGALESVRIAPVSEKKALGAKEIAKAATPFEEVGR